MLRGKALPAAKSVTRAPAAEVKPAPRGVAAGDKGVVFDVGAGTVSNGKATVKVDARQDPMNTGVVGVDPSGTQALVMASRSERRDPALVLVDLQRAQVTTVHAVDGAGWVAGGFVNGAVVVCEQVLGDEPRFSVLVNGKRVWSVPGMQPGPCVPVEVDGDVCALLLCLKPDPMTQTGPASLCVLDLQSGNVAALAPAQGSRVHVDGKALVVDGGRESVRVELA